MTGREPFEGSDQPMDLTEIDRLCDVFEQRLRQGEALTIVQFLTELRIEGNPELAEELTKVVQEFSAADFHRTQIVLPSVDMRSAVMPGILKPDSVIGKYQLLKQLGKGGMGVVFLAQQFEPVRRQVAMTAVAFVDPDGKQFLTSCSDGFVRLWQRGSGWDTRKLEPPGESAEGSDLCLRSVAMHPTAQLALTARIDGFVRFWNVSSGMPSGPVLACGAPVLFAEFVEGGSKVVTGDDGDLIRTGMRRQVAKSSQQRIFHRASPG